MSYVLLMKRYMKINFLKLLIIILFIMNTSLCFASQNGTLLLKLAENKFENLTTQEIKLINCTADGKLLDFSSMNTSLNDPLQYEKWGNDRSIRASVIEWLCTDRDAYQFITHLGIQLKGAYISGVIDLLFSNINFPLLFQKCAISDGIILLHSELKSLYLPGSYVRNIIGDGVTVNGNLIMNNGFSSSGELRFLGGKIFGNIQCDGAIFNNENGYAFNADRIEVKGSVFFNDGFKAIGEINLVTAKIENDLSFAGSSLQNENLVVINADRLRVNGNVALSEGFKSNGQIRFLGAEIGGNLQCNDCSFFNNNNDAFLAQGMKVNDNIYFTENFKSIGNIDLLGIVIGGSLEFMNCEITGYLKLSNSFVNEYVLFDSVRIINTANDAIIADGMECNGIIHFKKGNYIYGETRFVGATINGQFICDDVHFFNNNNKSLNLAFINLKNTLVLTDKVAVEGETRLVGAVIDGDISIEGAELRNSSGYSLRADRVSVKGSVFLRQYLLVDGIVSFSSANILGNFAVNNIKQSPYYKLDLRSANVGVLWDSQDSWPSKGNLFLSGFEYNSIRDESSFSSEIRLQWLNRQPNDSNKYQAFDYFARILKDNGYIDDANSIMYNKEVEITKQMPFLEKIFRKLNYYVIGYGYKPWRLMIIISIIVLVGSLVFKFAFRNNLMLQTRHIHLKPKPFFYSVDLFIPIIDLRQSKYWTPITNKIISRKILKNTNFKIHSKFIYYYFCFHIFAGWISTTLLIASLSGLIKIINKSI